MLAIRVSLYAFALVIALAQPALSQTAPLRWETNLDQAFKAAAASNRLVLVHFWAPWCRPCQKLEATVFKQPQLGAQLDPKYVAVKLDLDQNHELAKKYGVTAIPTDVILSPQGQVVYKTHSPQTAELYVSTMQQIAAKHGSAALVASKPVSAVPSVTPPPPVPQPQQQLPPSTAPMIPPVVAPSTPPIAPPTPNTKLAGASNGDSRYDYYFNRGGAEPSNVAAGPSSGAPLHSPPIAEPAVVAAQAPQSIATDPRISAQQPATSPAAASPFAPAVVAQSATPTQPPIPDSTSVAPGQAPAAPTAFSRGVITQAQLPPGSPALALDGFCPVTLSERRQWILGDVRFGAVHRGRTYLFTSALEQQKFLAQPDRFSPVMSGNDPVLALNAGQSVSGRREHGVFFNERVFLFSSEETLNEFAKNPTRYSAEITSAMKQ